MYPYRKTLSENPNFYPFSISSNPCPAATDLRFPSRNQASNRPSPTPKPLRSAIFDDQIQNPLSKDKSKPNAFPTKDLFRISENFLLWVPSSTPKHGGSPSLTCLSNSKIYGQIGWDTDHLDLALNGVNQMELHTDLGSLTTPLKQDGLPKAVDRCGSGWWSSFGLSTQIYSLRHVWWNYWILRWWLFPWRGPGPLWRPSDVPSLHYGSSRMVPWELVKLIRFRNRLKRHIYNLKGKRTAEAQAQ